jgi:hypothetical protein
VNPEEQFDRQVMLQLLQLTAPALVSYPLGTRLMLKRLWTVFDQKGFDEIYPEAIAQLQTQQQMLAAQVQVAMFEGQLQQLQQQEAQQQQAILQQGAQQFHQTGQLSPEFVAAAEQLMAGQGANGATPQGGGAP